MALHLPGLQLLTVDGVGHPLAGDHQTLAGGGAGDGAYHRYHLAVGSHQAQDGIAVFLVLEDEIEYGTVHSVLFAHAACSLVISPV